MQICHHQEKLNNACNNETFYETTLKDITPGEYDWFHLSLSYQDYNIKHYIGHLISFNIYIKNLKINDQHIGIKSNKKKGWG